MCISKLASIDIALKAKNSDMVGLLVGKLEITLPSSRLQEQGQVEAEAREASCYGIIKTHVI